MSRPAPTHPARNLYLLPNLGDIILDIDPAFTWKKALISDFLTTQMVGMVRWCESAIWDDEDIFPQIYAITSEQDPP